MSIRAGRAPARFNPERTQPRPYRRRFFLPMHPRRGAQQPHGRLLAIGEGLGMELASHHDARLIPAVVEGGHAAEQRTGRAVEPDLVEVRRWQRDVQKVEGGGRGVDTQAFSGGAIPTTQRTTSSWSSRRLSRPSAGGRKSPAGGGQPVVPDDGSAAQSAAQHLCPISYPLPC